MERIGELLSKGVAIMLAQETSSASEKSSPDRVIDMTKMDEHSRSILQFIRKVGFASPGEIEQRLSLKRRTALRKLKHLLESDILIKKGKTSSTRYELSDGIVL